MTNNEIIKALECCGKPVDENCCSECPYHCYEEDCHKLLPEAIDLINRQKAEIEALIAGQETLQKYRDEEINRLEIELKAMRGAANSYKAEVERLTHKNVRLSDMLKASTKLINRQKAEIERLETNLEEAFAEIETLKHI